MNEVIQQWYLYVLLLEEDFFYIGMALYPEERIKAHFIGEGANFTKKHKPIKVVEMYPLEPDTRKNCYKLETAKTREYRAKFGRNKVVGGKHLRLGKAK